MGTDWDKARGRGGGERGVSGAWKPARDWEAEETAAAPAFAWIPALRQGPPLADASLPLGSGRRVGGPSWRRTCRSPTLAALDLSGSAACRCLCFGFLLRALGSLPSRTLTADPPPCLPPAFTCSWSGQRASRPGPRRRVRNVAQWVRNLFPPPPLRSPERRWAGESRDRASGGRVAGGSRDEPSGKTLPLSVWPGKSSLAAASRERAGGRPNGEGSRGVGNGCHVAQVDRRPLPPRRDL